MPLQLRWRSRVTTLALALGSSALVGTSCGTPRRFAYTFALTPCPTQPLNLATRATGDGATILADRGQYDPIGPNVLPYRLTLPDDHPTRLREYHFAVLTPQPGECQISVVTEFLETSRKDGARMMDDLDYGLELAVSLLLTDQDVAVLHPVARRDTLNSFTRVPRLAPL